LDDHIATSTRVHSKMIHELAQELARTGHQPIVITPGCPNQKNLLKIDIVEDVTFWSFRNGSTRGVGKLTRAINETLLSVNAWRAIRNEVALNPIDGVINYSPSIFYGGLVQQLKKKFQCPSYLILRDLFPQWVIDEGMIRENSLIAKYFKFFEHLNYKYADHIGLMSDANLKVFDHINPGYPQKHVLHNWAKMTPVSTELSEVSIREKLGLADKTIFFYGGNTGHAQDMENLLRLARSMNNNKNAHFLFVGSGDEYSLIESLKVKWNLENVTILPSVSQDEFKKILANVDIGLFSLSKTHKAHNFPGKLLAYMVQSLPIIGSVNPGNDLIHIINNYEVGFAFVNGQDDKLLSAAKSLADNAIQRRKFGENANNLLEKYFSVESAAEKIISYLNASSSNVIHE
ncbi:MAG: glycosyltransferase family 4 protein, partial [Colwellia sp.]